MRNNIIVFSYFMVLILLFSGCTEDEQFSPPNYVTFESNEIAASVNEGSSSTVEVTLYTANVTGTERTFLINVDESSTLDPAAYTLPESVTVPAGTNEATFTVDVSDTNLSNTGDTLVLSLGDERDLSTGDPLTIDISRVCPIDLQDYVGSFTGTGSWSEIFGYTTEVETFLNEEGDLMINGLVFQWFQDWWGETIVRNEPVMMEVDLETGVITIPEQFYIESTYGGDPQPLYSIKGTGRINSCEGEMVIRPVLVQDGAEIDPVSFGGVPFLETIRLETGAGEGDGTGDGEDDGTGTSEGDETEEGEE